MNEYNIRDLFCSLSQKKEVYLYTDGVSATNRKSHYFRC